MFRKIDKTSFPPSARPVMIWDGACGFCKYWVTFLKEKTGDKIDYEPYQKVLDTYRDVPERDFKEAVRLIDTEGHVYDGPDAAYRIVTYYLRPILFWHRAYHKSGVFRLVSDYGYELVSNNRSAMLKITKILWGSNPTCLKPYWLVYLVLVAGLIYIMI